MEWKPGQYVINCNIQIPGFGFPINLELDQEVGARTTDLVVVGWIVPGNVPLSPVGVNWDVLEYYPLDGDVPLFQVPKTTLHLGLVSAGGTIRPVVPAAMNAADREYIINWMFRYGATHVPPPFVFSDEDALLDFKNIKTNYKLFNRFQVKYLLGSSGVEFDGNPVILNYGTTTGNTIDPISRILIFTSTTGDYEGVIQMKENKTVYQTNDGSPGDPPVWAFNTLADPLKWNHIGSSICFGVDFELGFDVLHQVYPTYNLYERKADGSFHLIQTIPQAASPLGNFNINPYDPPLLGSAPFLVE